MYQKYLNKFTGNFFVKLKLLKKDQRFSVVFFTEKNIINLSNTKTLKEFNFVKIFKSKVFISESTWNPSFTYML